MSQSKRWCFTLNNWTEAERDHLRTVLGSDEVKYAIFGYEEGEEEHTPHLQGYVYFQSNQRFHAVKNKLGQRCHIRLARGTTTENYNYCSKEGSSEEFGDRPVDQGKSSPFEAFRDWVVSQPSRPSERDVASNYPGLYTRYRSNVMALVNVIYPGPQLVTGEFRVWQRELHERLSDDADDRTVNFYVDLDGGKGKSWFIRYYLTHHNDRTQRLSCGRRDDLAYALLM
jgi:Putative viral replication protein.